MKRVLIPYRRADKLATYAVAARRGGVEPFGVEASGEASLNGAAGLLLMGGSDVNPELYGERPRPETDAPDDDRDRIELQLIEQAMQRDVPILAICRGLQILNVYHGGTLIQHLGSKRHDSELENKAQPAHEVRFEHGSLLADIAGAERWQVNSRHHQAVRRIGAGLQVSALDPEDQTIEGLERHDRKFVVAVQWHPEDQIIENEQQVKLFRRFAEACG